MKKIVLTLVVTALVLMYGPTPTFANTGTAAVSACAH